MFSVLDVRMLLEVGGTVLFMCPPVSLPIVLCRARPSSLQCSPSRSFVHICVSVSVRMSCACVEARGQPRGVSSVFPPFPGSPGMEWDGMGCPQVAQ